VILSLVSGKPDLFVGTGGLGFGCGSNSPAVQMPYSYVRLGPDTTPIEKVLYEEFQHYGGYSSADHAVRAFSHMHLVGAGVGDLGVLGILPVKPNSPEK
jgi:putative alpha-1,2-mannosidase